MKPIFYSDTTVTVHNKICLCRNEPLALTQVRIASRRLRRSERPSPAARRGTELGQTPPIDLCAKETKK